MPEIHLQKPRDNDEDICCRCGTPKRIGCHHDKADEIDRIIERYYVKCPFCKTCKHGHPEAMRKRLEEGTKNPDGTIRITNCLCESGSHKEPMDTLLFCSECQKETLHHFLMTKPLATILCNICGNAHGKTEA